MMWNKLGIALLAMFLLTSLYASSQPVITPPVFVPQIVAGIQVPGVSQALFNNPYYTCNTNYYVSTTGSDAADGTAPTSGGGHGPWLTIQHASDTVTNGTGPGSWCINVLPGTYATGTVTSRGGTTASSTGYIVYRCTQLLQCIITDNGNNGANGAMAVNGLPTSNPLVGYVWFDGFKMTSGSGLQTQFGNGMGSQSTDRVEHFCCHHLWFTNNEVSGYGQGGIQAGESDFVYVVHNNLHDNSAANGCDAGAQGSGYSNAVPFPIPVAYTLTADDKSNSVVGNMAAPNGTGQFFQQVTMWNISHNNRMDTTGCTPTDGNGIIMDTLNNINGANLVYQHQGLIAFNLTYNNGGSGIKLTEVDNPPGSANVGFVVANNTSYNDAIQANSMGGNCAFFEIFGDSDLFINNIAYTFTPTSNNCDFEGDAAGGAFYFESLFQNNLALCVGAASSGCTTATTGTNGPMFNGAIWSATNHSATNPLWVNVGGSNGSGTAGGVSTPPSSTNFALSSNSLAIGFGQTKSYLPSQSTDAGACHHTLAVCP